MKKILIVIHNMRIGGAQRSLLSFLQQLSATGHSEYDISVMAIEPAGEFALQMPRDMALIPPPTPLRWLGSKFNAQLLREHFSWKSLWAEACWLIKKHCKRFPARWNLQQKLWYSWGKYIPQNSTHYDVAISYMDGVPNYYVMDKVQADKKVLWLHNEYGKLGYCPDFDKPYYEKAETIITISEQCRQCVAQQFPQCAHKIHILENITAAATVMEKSAEGEYGEFADFDGFKLLSVGRLNVQKGYDLAIESAKILQTQKIPFLWLVLGEGPERENLEKQIADSGVADCFRLLGSKENPYGYMANCDILVQPSRFEGKSVVLDEARVLCKPVVVAAYTTAKDAVRHGYTGYIAEMSPEGIAEGIGKMYYDEALREHIKQYLQSGQQGNEHQLHRYLELML